MDAEQLVSPVPRHEAYDRLRDGLLDFPDDPMAEVDTGWRESPGYWNGLEA